jgi:hypothetical protein
VREARTWEPSSYFHWEDGTFHGRGIPGIALSIGSADPNDPLLEDHAITAIHVYATEAANPMRAWWGW